MKIPSKSPQLKTFYWIANLRDWFKQFWDRQQQAGFLWDRNPCLSFLQQVLDSTNKWFNQVETEFVRRRLQRQRNNRRGTIGLVVIGFALVWLFAGCQGSQNQQGQIALIKNDKVKVLKAEIRDYKVLKYLKSISGHQTVAGQHNKEPLSDPDKSTEEISTIISESPGEKKYPGLWSSDFLFKRDDIANRQTMINEAKEQWNEGAIINLMYHACPPTQSEDCDKWEGGVKSDLSEDDWKKLLTDGEELNKEWKLRLDKVAYFLKKLQDQGVEVLWRPLHEMNKTKETDEQKTNFWWAGRPEYSPKLYQITHDYLVKEKRLTNLIWVWDLQDFNTLEKDLRAYDPGDSYWDIAALDIYGSDNQGFSPQKYEAMKNYAVDEKGKLIAIGECFTLPSVSELKTQPRWTFFMGWDQCVYCKDKGNCPNDCSGKLNSNKEIRDLYNDPNILTRDEVKKGRG